MGDANYCQRGHVNCVTVASKWFDSPAGRRAVVGRVGPGEQRATRRSMMESAFTALEASPLADLNRSVTGGPITRLIMLMT